MVLSRQGLPAGCCGLVLNRSGRMYADRQRLAKPWKKDMATFMRNRNWLWIVLGFAALALFCVAVTAKAEQPRRGPLGLVDWRGQLTVPCPVWPSEPWSAPQNTVNRLGGQESQTVVLPPPPAEVPTGVYVAGGVAIFVGAVFAGLLGSFSQLRQATAAHRVG